MECTACGLQLQVRSKYDLQRHWETKHKDRLDKNEKASSRMIAGDTETLADFLARKKKVDTKDGGEMVEEEKEQEDMELEEGVGEESKKRGLDEIESDGEDGNGNKKSKGNVVELLWKRLQVWTQR